MIEKFIPYLRYDSSNLPGLAETVWSGVGPLGTMASLTAELTLQSGVSAGTWHLSCECRQLAPRISTTEVPPLNAKLLSELARARELGLRVVTLPPQWGRPKFPTSIAEFRESIRYLCANAQWVVDRQGWKGRWEFPEPPPSLRLFPEQRRCFVGFTPDGRQMLSARILEADAIAWALRGDTPWQRAINYYGSLLDAEAVRVLRELEQFDKALGVMRQFVIEKRERQQRERKRWLETERLKSTLQPYILS